MGQRSFKIGAQDLGAGITQAIEAKDDYVRIARKIGTQIEGRRRYHKDPTIFLKPPEVPFAASAQD